MAARETRKQAARAPKAAAAGATTGCEAELWAMADALRSRVDAAEYKHGPPTDLAEVHPRWVRGDPRPPRASDGEYVRCGASFSNQSPRRDGGRHRPVIEMRSVKPVGRQR